jgi:uncharacterized cupredoxin-like copper-binding protein
MSFVRAAVVASALVLGLAAAPHAFAEDASFAIEMADGKLTPTRLVVPAGKPFKLVVTNAGSGSAEFESKSLHKEKVIAPKASITISVKALTKGEYDFFDEHQPSAAPGVIVAE